MRALYTAATGMYPAASSASISVVLKPRSLLPLASLLASRAASRPDYNLGYYYIT